MTEGPPSPAAPKTENASPSPGYPTQSPAKQLERYFGDNRGRYTEEALTAAARDAGYSAEAIEAGLARAREAEAASPVRTRARSIVLWAYLITFLVLTGMMAAQGDGVVVIGGGILGVTLLLTLALSLFLVRGVAATTTVAAAVTAPIILLLVVAGACLATGLPLHPFMI